MRFGVVSERRRKRAFQAILSGLRVAARESKQVRFMTLTSVFGSPDIRKSFSTLVKRIRRKFGRFEYLSVVEFTKSGLPHIHVLYRGGFHTPKVAFEGMGGRSFGSYRGCAVGQGEGAACGGIHDQVFGEGDGLPGGVFAWLGVLRVSHCLEKSV